MKQRKQIASILGIPPKKNPEYRVSFEYKGGLGCWKVLSYGIALYESKEFKTKRGAKQNLVALKRVFEKLKYEDIELAFRERKDLVTIKLEDITEKQALIIRDVLARTNLKD